MAIPSFNKQATTKQFYKRTKFIDIIKKEWKPALNIKETKDAYYGHGVYIDPKRNIEIYISWGRKVKGLGAGRYNEIIIQFYNFYKQPVFENKSLTKQDLQTYFNEYGIK